MRRFLRANGLSLTMFGLFAAMVVALSIVGWLQTNDDLALHGEAREPYIGYLFSGAFAEAIFENWESEFLQMGTYVLLTAFLVQRGSPDSRPLAGRAPQDEDPARHRRDGRAPWPVRAGGVWARLYSHSLTIALIGLFALSFVAHVLAGAADYNETLRQHGTAPISPLQYLVSAKMWFESLQNWQSEFLSVGTLIVLSIFLRQRGSPESKAVHEPSDKTGG